MYELFIQGVRYGFKVYCIVYVIYKLMDMIIVSLDRTQNTPKNDFKGEIRR